MSKYEVYPSYKDSGVEWLGEIPEHWETSRLKFLCNITTGGKDTENKVDDGEYPFYVRSQTVERINSYSFNGEAILTAGDGVGVGKVFHYTNGKFDFHQRVYMFYAFRNVAGKFLFEYIKNNFYKVALAGVAKSTVDSLRLPLIQNFMITVPPLHEQQTIANYLDSATAKIDTLIEKQTKLIELLKEKRQAVISTAVTRGLDSTVAMKDSGVEWLGEIPEGWNEVSLKYISKITLGKMLTSSDKGNMSFRPYLKAKNLKWMNVSVANVDNMWFNDNELKSLRLKKDDLLVSEGGEVGRTCIWNNELAECYIQNSVNRVQFTKHHPKFFLYQFYAAGHYGYFDSIVNKISIAHLTKEKLGDAKFVATPIKEQEAIVTYLDDITSKIDNLITKSTKAIDLLKEKRTALISAVVTGKIDVRESA